MTADRLVLLGETVCQVLLPQTLEVPLSRLVVTRYLEKKKKAYSDVLWLKLNQVRLGGLIREKEKHTETTHLKH